MSDLDDAAAAALWALERKPLEHIGLLYEQGGRIQATPTKSRNKAGEVKGRFSIPAGSLRGIFHNHPITSERGGRVPRRADLALFSDSDITQADRLGVPSYIVGNGQMRRYMPGSGTREGEPVLAEIPIDVIVRDLMVRLLNRDPNDPRGLYRESSNFPGLFAN